MIAGLGNYWLAQSPRLVSRQLAESTTLNVMKRQMALKSTKTQPQLEGFNGARLGEPGE
ncbi:MAG: hypothetical protein IT380_02400, partial [Myxococcales bacterium]|nr:hypothetical protein [Myxococcales bacterium]